MDKNITLLKANPQQALKDLKTDEIVAILQAASDAYYNSETSVISDDLYDIAKEYLEIHVPNHPFLKEVGAPIKGEKVDLPYWMGSMNKIRDDEKSIVKWMNDYPGDVVISDKLDGNSGMLVITPSTKTLYSRGN